ncbi:MAG: substrate-binding domain-containing protein, partial [Clostridiales Family XIII bacterium]|nr:substrate-binding domain-containing protein [Clostridiales Family XIII bacterium]
MKNWKIILAAIILIISIAIFGYGQYRDAKLQAKTHPFKIGVVVYRADDAYISEMSMAMEEHMEEVEAHFDTKINLKIVDANNDQVEQNSLVDGFIRNGYDALAINLVDRTVAAVIIDKAKQAGIPVVFFNREPVRNDLIQWNKAYYVGSKAKESGEMEGDIVVEAYKRNPAAVDRNGDGKLQYVMLEGEKTHQDTLIRTESSVDEIISSGIPLERL